MFRNSKKIQTILTCDVLAILSEGNEELTFEPDRKKAVKIRKIWSFYMMGEIIPTSF